MARLRTAVMLAAGAAVLAGGAAVTLVRPERPAPESPSQGSADQVVHIDPRTGRRVPRPARRDPVFEAARRARLNRSAAGLLERPGPHGGVMVDLRGRFRSSTVARIGADGALDTDCAAGPTPQEVGR